MDTPTGNLKPATAKRTPRKSQENTLLDAARERVYVDEGDTYAEELEYLDELDSRDFDKYYDRADVEFGYTVLRRLAALQAISAREATTAA
jgi:hypothetical protein